MKITDTQKDVRAGTMTGIICGALIMMFFIISWTIPAPEIPPVEEGMEVNLGNSDEGLGVEAPKIPGPPAAEKEDVDVPPKTQVTPVEEVKEVETNDNDKEAPEAVIPKPVTPKKESTVIPKKETTTPTRPATTKPPRAVYISRPASRWPTFRFPSSMILMRKVAARISLSG